MSLQHSSLPTFPCRGRWCHTHYILRTRSWIIVVMVMMMMMTMLLTTAKATRRTSTTRLCMSKLFLGRSVMVAFVTADYRVKVQRGKPQQQWHYTRTRSFNVQSSSSRAINGSRFQCTHSSSITCPIRMFSTADDSRLTTITTTILNENDRKPAQEQKQALYQELHWLSQEIRRLDDLYYNNNNDVSNDNNQGSSTIVSDDEYDALCRREAEICQQYPDLLEQWERESGLGKQATRYGGRVGIAVLDIAGDEQGDDSQGIERAMASTETTTAIGRIKRKHHKPMLSLDNVHDTTQLLAWLERIRKKIHASRRTTNEKSNIDNSNSTTTPAPMNVIILTEPKLDGLSLNLCYQKQDNNSSSFQLAWAATRGDGKQGQDVTSAVRQLVPQKVQIPKSITTSGGVNVMEVRGEVIFPSSVFQLHVREHQQRQLEISDKDGDNTTTTTSTSTIFSNARNAASGILLRKESLSHGHHDENNDEWRSKLCFYAYDLYTPQENEMLLDLEQIRTQLQGMGFSVPQPVVISTLRLPPDDDKNRTLQESDIPGDMLRYYHALQKHRESPDTTSAVDNDFEWGDYEMDGCVHKLVNGSLQELLGYSNRAPRWAVAHKFPATAVVTELLQIQVQVGRTGALTPVAILQPVELNGVLVQRATLHNFGHMRHILGQGNSSLPKGSKVLVRRAGEVIPQVVSLVGNSNAPSASNKGDEDSMISLEEPTSCPSCGSSVIVDDTVGNKSNRTSLGQVLRCGGPPLLCLPRAVSALRHAYSRDALDVTGLSEARIQQLMDAGLIRLPGDIFQLVRDPDKIESIAEMDGWGKKSATNLQVVVNKVATEGVSLSRFIYSLGIRFVGVHSSALIAKIYGTVEAFLSDIERAGTVSCDAAEDIFVVLRDENEDTKGIGPSVLGSLTAFAKEKELVEAAKLLAEKIWVHPDTSLSSSSVEAASEELPFQGLSVVFTGSLQGMSRSDAQKIAKRMGAKSTPSSLSKSTGILVIGKKVGKKLEEARKLGVRVLDGSEFIAIVESFQNSGS